jgi:hypothetical protein
MAAQRRRSVKVLVQPAEGLVGGDRDGVLLLAFGEDWNSSSAPRRSRPM